MGVFANGLEISGKAVSAKTIAAMPDVCFTPPENPATPPGVPVPYPSFGMAGDTDKGTGTVKIGGKTVNIKNKSHLTKTTGTEAGSAAKKGIITSKNTGKEQFNSWSNDVKFDGEPVIRNTDMATNNHASPAGNTPPWLHVCAANFGSAKCVDVLADVGIDVHTHSKSKCEAPDESEHFVRNQFFQKSRGKTTYKKWGKYRVQDAPCICMKSRHTTPAGKVKSGSGSKRETPHWWKTKKVREFLKLNKKPTLREAMDTSIGAVKEHHTKIKDQKPKKQKHIAECLKLIHLEYLRSVSPKKKGKNGKLRPQTNKELLDEKVFGP